MNDSICKSLKQFLEPAHGVGTVFVRVITPTIHSANALALEPIGFQSHETNGLVNR